MKLASTESQNASGMMVVTRPDGEHDFAAIPGRPNRSIFRSPSGASIPPGAVELEDYVEEMSNTEMRSGARNLLSRFTSGEFREDSFVWALRHRVGLR